MGFPPPNARVVFESELRVVPVNSVTYVIYIRSFVSVQAIIM